MAESSELDETPVALEIDALDVVSNVDVLLANRTELSFVHNSVRKLSESWDLYFRDWTKNNKPTATIMQPTTVRIIGIELELDSSSSSSSPSSSLFVRSPTGGVDDDDDGDDVASGGDGDVASGVVGVDGVSESVSEKVPNGVLV